MKKLILLLFIPLVFTCSDDSSDNSNQLFLDIYDGVVWIVSNTDDSGFVDSRITFFNNPESYITYSPFEVDYYCVTVVFGETYGPGPNDNHNETIRITVHHQDENSITLRLEESGEEDVYYSFTGNNSGNSLAYEVQYPDTDEIIQRTYVLYSGFNPCD